MGAKARVKFIPGQTPQHEALRCFLLGPVMGWQETHLFLTFCAGVLTGSDVSPQNINFSRGVFCLGE